MPPTSRPYDPKPSSSDAIAIEDLYLQEFRGRQAAFNLATDYYYGIHKQHLLPDGTNTEDNVTVNLTGLIIDKGVSALMGTNEQGTILGPDFEMAEEIEKQQAREQQPAIQKMMSRAKSMMADMMGMPQDTGENPAKEYLDSLWEANHKELFLHDLAMVGGLSGHCYVKIDPTHMIPDPDGDTNEMFPRLIVLNPANVAKFWHPLDTERVLWYTIVMGYYQNMAWAEGAYKQDIVCDVTDTGEDMGSWTIYEYEMMRGKSGWQLVNTVKWGYDFCPIIEWKNLPRANHPYGCNDLDIQVVSSPNATNFTVSRGIVGLNDSLNFTLSNVQRIIKHHAAPKTIGIGISEDAPIMESSIGGFFTTQASKADVEIKNLEMQSDLASSLNFAALLRSGTFTSARELDPSTVQDKLGQITNFGIRVMSADKLGKIGTKRLLYGMGLECICRCCLELAGYGKGVEIVTKWPDPLPSDPLQTAQALMLDRQNGLSQDTYLERRGYDPEVEAQKREREQAEKVQVAQTLNDAGTNDQMVSQGQMQRQMSDTMNGRNQGQQNGNGNGYGGNQQ